MATQDMRKAIVQAFKASGKTMLAVSRESGLPFASVHAMAHGTGNPTLTTVEKIARVLSLELRQVRRGK